MTGLRPLSDDTTIADVFLDGQPYQIITCLTYWLCLHRAACGAKVTLADWDTWEKLGERLGARWGRHVWHPSHWDQHYATMADVPASTPGAVPLTPQRSRQDTGAIADTVGTVLYRTRHRRKAANQLNLLEAS